jgi:hypothetical protein
MGFMRLEMLRPGGLVGSAPVETLAPLVPKLAASEESASLETRLSAATPEGRQSVAVAQFHRAAAPLPTVAPEEAQRRVWVA